MHLSPTFISYREDFESEYEQKGQNYCRCNFDDRYRCLRDRLHGSRVQENFQEKIYIRRVNVCPLFCGDINKIYLKKV